MAEQLVNLAYTFVAGGGYTAASGFVNVLSTTTGSGPLPLPSAFPFSISLSDPTSGAVSALLTVTAANSPTQFAVTSEGLDISCVAGFRAQAVQTARSLAAAIGQLTVPWTGLSYSNSWTDFGSGLQAGQFSRDQTGRVTLRGVIKPGTLTAATTIFTLPAGSRPLTKTLIVTGADPGSATPVMVELEFNTSGAVKLSYTVSVPDISIEGLNFSIL